MDSAATSSPWQTARFHSGLVSLPGTSRQISVTVNGQPRPEPTSPLVIISAGLGGLAAEHVVVAQLVAPFARVLSYDRAGYGSSTALGSDDGPYTMETGAQDLSMVLKEINLPPPYVLVGQSFGGVFIREFLRQRGSKDIEGMVFVDCIPNLVRSEGQGLSDIYKALCGGGDNIMAAVGLSRNIVLTAQQLEDYERDEKSTDEKGGPPGEADCSDASVATVNDAFGMRVVEDTDGHVIDVSFSEKPLGKGRLSVIIGDIPRDLESVIKYGKQHGHANDDLIRTGEERLERIRHTIPKFQAAQIELTEGEARVRKATGSGRTHNLHMTRPDIVAEEVRWVLAGCTGMHDTEDLLKHD